LKDNIKFLLQKTLGYERYLFVFALFTIRRLRSGKHEREFAHFLDLVPDEGAILDIGANVGVMTTLLAMKRRKATVFAFEPVPENMRALKRVIARHGLKNVQVFETALGNENGHIEIVRPVVNRIKMQGLSHVVSENDNSEWNRGEKFSVTIRRLDDMDVLREVPEINAIKLDVENFEYYVLLGARELILKHKPVIYCELWANGMRARCIGLLAELGYIAWVQDGEKLQHFNGQDVTNFIFIPS